MKSLAVVFVLTLAFVTLSCSGKVTVNTPANNSNTAAAANSPAAGTNANNAASTSSDTNASVTVTGKWEMVGKEGDWKGTVDMVGMDGFIWSVEADGSLYKTDPATGNYTQIGDKGSFSHVKHLEGMNHMLFTVEGDTLYKTDPATGKWERMGEGGGWGKTVAMVALNGTLYSVEPDGTLWKTDMSGNDTIVDKGDFKGCTDLAAMNNKLWTIENGNLYWTDPATLKWQQVGKDGDFNNVSAMVGGAGFLWMIDNTGTLYKVDPNGASTVLGERGSYGHTNILTTLNGKLWTAEDGNLYKTS